MEPSSLAPSDENPWDQSDGHSKPGLVENIASIAKELQKRHLDTQQRSYPFVASKLNCQTTLVKLKKTGDGFG